MRLVTFVLVLVLLSGCAGTLPTFSDSDLTQLAVDYRAALSRDEELSPIFGNFSIDGTGAMLGTLQVNGKTWAGIPRAQRERFVRKAAIVYDKQFIGSPVQRLGVSSVTIKDDIGATLGWIVVSVSGDVQYRLYGR